MPAVAMPLAYSIDAQKQIVTITGDYSDADGWRTLLAAVASDPDYQRGYGFIRDLRHSAHPVDANTVIAILAVVREFWQVLGVRRAAMVTRHGINTPAAVAEALAQDQQVALRAFTSFHDAVEWVSGGQ